MQFGMDNLQVLQDSFSDFASGRLATKVRGENGSFTKNLIDSTIDLKSFLSIAEVFQEKSSRSDGSNGVGNVLASNIRGRTMDRLAHDKVITNISGRNDTKGTNKGGSTITT
jgi:hypothetical protein